ncbi:ABC transporter ATP-binding protein [Paenibacillus tengchongensis]|uniref:ABC transporter ATP-binding protein n=1 Tax=Paenibacillus tengchongensis TaxID=2608684 RepID=UPI00124CD1C2|nr:ATP-binding cassette domain-containing protein [Paenibacillus tengchongensis]
MSVHIAADGLTKTYRVPVREAGLGAAVRSLFRPRFDEVQAVRDVSFQIERGEMVGFIGPNGAGKTTTLKMLSGLLYPTSGSVDAAGHTPWKRKTQYLSKISMLMGNRSQLQWNNTVYDTLYIFKEIYGVPSDVFKRHLAELCDLLDLAKLLPKRSRNLSLGERSKCEFALALLHQPEILYLDEPTLGMDVTMQLRLREYIREYNRRFGATVILTSHYMSDVTSLCGRVLLINGGELVYDGKLAKLQEMITPFKIVKLTLDQAELTQEELVSQGIEAELTERKDNEYMLRVKKQDAVTASGLLMSLYNIVDFSIADPPMEAVIDKIYTEGGLG